MPHKGCVPGYSFFVFLLILLARLHPVRQIGSRPLILGVLPPVATILADAVLDARLTLAHPPV